MASICYIDVKSVVAVLLADGWHEVVAGSVSIASYKFIANRVAIGPGVEGFRFAIEDGSVVTGSLASILAVKQRGHD